MNTSQSQVKRTDFYEIIPLSDSYIIILGDTVVGAYTFSSMDEAEEFVLWNYEELAGNSGVNTGNALNQPVGNPDKFGG